MVRTPSRKTFRPRLDEMVTTIRNNIITGLIEPGQLLPSEKQLAEQYGLSVQSVRKGLDMLVGETLIVKVPKVGSRVINPAEKGAVTIRLGYTPTLPDDADLHQLIAMFHREHPNIRVQSVCISDGATEPLRQQLESGMLDLMTMNYPQFRQFIEGGGLDDLDVQQRKEELYPFLSDAFTVGGELRIQPFVFSPFILCYNRDHFLEKGLQEPNSSWSWQRLFDCAAALEIPNERIGFRCYFSTVNRASILLMQKGKSFERGEDGHLKLRGTPMLEAIRYSRGIYANIPALPNSLMDWDKEKLEMFRQGKVSIILTSYYVLNHLRHSDVPYDIAPVPHFGEALTLTLPIGMAISRHCKNKEAARKLIDFIVSKPAQQHIRQNLCSIPARVLSAEWSGPDTINRPSRFSLFREIIPSYRLYTDLNLRAYEYNNMYRELGLYWAGLQDEEALCDRLESLAPWKEQEVYV
ncbi:MAG: GntR family transcriptional regulator [Paenibacillus sp.]|nr:GntR family transcriptional regulator [Paenibacillus sp.]